MKKIAFALLALSQATLAEQNLSTTWCPSLSQLENQGGNYEYYGGLIKGGDPIHTLANENYTVTAEESAKTACIANLGESSCNSLGSTIIDYLYGDETVYYSYYDLVNSMSHTDANKYTIPARSRGITTLGVGALWNKLLCEYTMLYWQSAPTISANSLTRNSSSISASVTSTYDTSYSAAAVNETPPNYTWVFENLDYSGVVEIVTNQSTSITHSPQYDGTYSVSSTIDDGTFEATTELGIILYNGGSTGPCTGSRCQNRN